MPARRERRSRILLSSDGVPIHHRAEGKGSPALVFVHCWSGDGSYWDSQVAHFSSRHTVVTIDLAGHGRSGSGRSAWTIPAFAEDVRAVVGGLDLAEAVLIGHSMSGAVIVEAARRMPGRVLALVPVDTLHDAEFRPHPAEIETFLAPMRRDFRRGVEEYVRGLFPAGADAVLVERIASDMAAAPPDVAIGALEGYFSYDLASALRQIMAPIRCINAPRFPTRIEVNRRHAPQFDALIMPGVGHFPMLEAPGAFNRALEEILRGFGRDGAAP